MVIAQGSELGMAVSLTAALLLGTVTRRFVREGWRGLRRKVVWYTPAVRLNQTGLLGSSGGALRAHFQLDPG